jgi:anion-transporting  ArsA/GET3 family ATPase
MSPSHLRDLIWEKRVLICCGSGGVGKTTTAAAISLYAAMEGLKTIVLTIDPAKRLATSLGIADIDYRERQIPAEEWEKIGLNPKAPLYAMMLDTKRTFDHLIQKYSSNSETAEAILNNKLYQHLSNMMAGSQEYMAMEKLFEVAQDGDYDLIVLDTPPSRHALDFLEAPEKMRHMIGDSILRLFLKPSIFISRAGFKLLDKSMRRIMSSFDKVTGFEFLQDLSEMLVTTSGLLEGFQERAERVEKLLHDLKTSFLLVASPQPIPLREVEFFYRKIDEYGFPFGGFIFNRVQEIPEGEESPPTSLTTVALKELEAITQLFQKLFQRDHQEIHKFQKKIDGKTRDYFYQTVPQLDRDVHDLASLYEMTKFLF